MTATRRWLNEDEAKAAAILTNVSDFDGGPYDNGSFEASVTVWDCERRARLDFSVWFSGPGKSNMLESMSKLDAILEELQKFRAAMFAKFAEAKRQNKAYHEAKK